MSNLITIINAMFEVCVMAMALFGVKTLINRLTRQKNRSATKTTSNQNKSDFSQKIGVFSVLLAILDLSFVIFAKRQAPVTASNVASIVQDLIIFYIGYDLIRHN